MTDRIVLEQILIEMKAVRAEVVDVKRHYISLKQVYEWERPIIAVVMAAGHYDSTGASLRAALGLPDEEPTYTIPVGSVPPSHLGMQGPPVSAKDWLHDGGPDG